MIGYFPDDGYTLDGFVREIPGAHGEMSFRYRPMTPEVRDSYIVMIDKAGPLKASIVSAEIVAKRIESWSATDHQGKALAVSSQALRRLHPILFTRIIGIVVGTHASDANEKKIATDQDDLMKQAEAVLNGHSLESDTKN